MQHVVEDEQAPSGVALIFVAASGENSIGVASGANLCLSPADVAACSGHDRRRDVLVMQLETPLETVRAAATIAAAHHVPVVLNPAPAQPLDDPLLRHDLGAHTERKRSGAAHRRARGGRSQRFDGPPSSCGAKGVGQVIVTLGARGAWVSAAEF